MNGMKRVFLLLCCFALLVTVTLSLLRSPAPEVESAGPALSPAQLQQEIALQEQRVAESQEQLADQLVAFYLGYGSEEATRALIATVEQEKATLAELESALAALSQTTVSAQ